MNERIGIGLIGLGSIGQRMLRNAAQHARVRPAVAFDPDGARKTQVLAGHPEVESVADVQALIEHPDVDVVYVASPPATHAAHASAALAAGRPVLCEKPLGIDLDASRALVAQAAASGVPNAVNFIYASGAGNALARTLAAGTLGRVHGAELVVHGRDWAARRYAEAPWLARDAQGGLLREVVSHYLFLSQRLFGTVEVIDARLAGGEADGAAETRIIAELRCGGVPVSLLASTEGAGPDRFEYTVWGERESRATVGLYGLIGSDGGPWQPVGEVPADPAAHWFSQQLDNIADWAGGGTHSMPDFEAAFAVQTAIEGLRRIGRERG
ncbi:MAG: Gfo/Idh/MocA family oxidoreductase [Gammaproteobacteria bacterium]|nr:Gfo/Idh/MocA family oxidoreductase [Gammaproteobacteria bacterium]